MVVCYAALLWLINTGLEDDLHVDRKYSKLFCFPFNIARDRAGRFGHRILCTRSLCKSERDSEKKLLFLVLADLGRRQEMQKWSEEVNGQEVDGLELESLNTLVP